jgi:uncharacterized protein DUF1501
MSFTRRMLIQSGLGALALAGMSFKAKRAKAASLSKPRKLIIVFNAGGWDTTYAFDPKPGLTTIDAPEGNDRRIGDMRIWADTSRPNVTTFFERYGSIAAIANGVQMMSFVHPDCWKRVLTGTPDDSKPDVGAICAWELGRDLPTPYLVLGKLAYTGPLAAIAARAGETKQIIGLLDRRLSLPPIASERARLPTELTSSERGLIEKYVTARAERERAVRGARGYNKARIDDFVSSIDRAGSLKKFTSEFGGREPTFDLDTQAELAAKALGGGLCQAALLQSNEGWDTHSNNDAQGGSQDRLFSSLTKLADTLTTQPGTTAGSKLVDETVVAVISEMGRTPKLNADKGKDHWPVTSALVFGAGVRGGKVYGGTDDGLLAKNMDLVSGEVTDSGVQLQFGNLAAGILALAGVDPSPYLGSVEAFHAWMA